MKNNCQMGQKLKDGWQAELKVPEGPNGAPEGPNGVPEGPKRARGARRSLTGEEESLKGQKKELEDQRGASRWYPLGQVPS